MQSSTSNFSATGMDGSELQSKRSGGVTLLDMPREIVLYIIEFIDPLSWPVCRFVNKRFDDLVKHVIAYRNAADDDSEPVRPALPLCYLAKVNMVQPFYDEPHLLMLVEGEDMPYFKSLIAPEDFADRLARQGRLVVLKWARNNGCPWSASTTAAAASAGHLDILQWAVDEGCEWNESTCARAAGGGHAGLIKWARERGCRWDERSCSEAARGGHLDLLMWLRSNGCRWDEQTCAEAAKAGHLEIVKWAISNGCPYDQWEETTTVAAAYGGQLDILQWLDSGYRYHMKWAAAAGGRLNTLKWAMRGRIQYSRELLESAVASGNIAMIEWLADRFKMAFKVCYTSCIMAAYKGDLAMLHQLLLMHKSNTHRHDQPPRQILISPLVCDAAAAGGRYKMMKWLAAQGCWWDSITCAFAAVRGHLELLHWLQVHQRISATQSMEQQQRSMKMWDTRVVLDSAYDQCVPSELEVALGVKSAWWEGLMIGAVDHDQITVLDWAQSSGFAMEMATTVMAYRGRLDLLQWAQAKGGGYAIWNARTCAVAIYGGHLQIVQWLRDNGCRWDERSCDAAALTGQLAILQWLRSRGCPWRVKTFTLAARGGHVEVLAWLNANGCPWSRAKALKEAVKEGHTRVVQWIRHQSTLTKQALSWLGYY